MSNKFQKYWEKRSEDIQKVVDKSADEYLENLKKTYINAKNKIIEKTNAFYGRYAKDNQIDLSEAKKRLNSDELKTFKEYNAAYYAEVRALGDEAFISEYKSKLRDMSGRAYINRQQELIAGIEYEIEMLYIKQNNTFTDVIKTAYQDGYYQNIYNLQQAGFNGSFTKIDNKTVEKAFMQKWHGDNFSGRIWQSKENLLQWLEDNIPKDFVRGYGVRELSKDLTEHMAIKYHEAERLVRTELSHVSNTATIDSYKEMGIENYRILATIDSRTSEICADMDGKIFKVNEAVAGINVPPFHPNCRSTTISYFPEDDGISDFDPDINSSETSLDDLVSDMVQNILNGKDIEKTFTEWAKNNTDSEYAAQVAKNSGKYKDFDENILQFSENRDIIDITSETRLGGDKLADDITGASGAIPRDDTKRMDEHALLYYEEIQKRTGDIENIAKNTGFSVEDIRTIKNHIFFNEYNLDGEKLKRFDPDYDMAVSWQRLIEGKDIKEMDIILLNHELMEYGLMKQGIPYSEAHKITEKSYNYKKCMDELDKKFKDKTIKGGFPNE